MKTVYKSMKRFEHLDGANFGPCLAQTESTRYGGNDILEWRIRKEDQRLSIIQFYGDGGGYSIFVQD